MCNQHDQFCIVIFHYFSNCVVRLPHPTHPSIHDPLESQPHQPSIHDPLDSQPHQPSIHDPLDSQPHRPLNPRPPSTHDPILKNNIKNLLFWLYYEINVTGLISKQTNKLFVPVQKRTHHM